MNIRKRMLKVANNLMEDVVKSFEMTEEEWKKYNELHPNAKRENHQIIPDRKNQGGNGRKIQMTDEQKKLHQKALSDEVKDRKEVAIELNTHAYTLDKLSNDESKEVRHWVAYHKNTSPKTLHKLSNDEDVNVRGGVAVNPNTSAKLFDKLIHDEDARVRSRIAQNPDTRAETLDKLSNDEDVDVRYEVAVNPNTSTKTLNKLSNDEDVNVRLTATSIMDFKIKHELPISLSLENWIDEDEDIDD